MKAVHQHTPLNHRFAIGAMVRFCEINPLRNAVQGPYEILAKLPQREGTFQYRVKSEREPYQRIIKEDELELA